MERNIKKTAAAFFAAAAVFAMGSVSTFAAGPGCGRYYEDADQDGVCDHYGEAGQQEAATDRKGNIVAAITDRKEPAEHMDAAFK